MKTIHDAVRDERFLSPMGSSQAEKLKPLILGGDWIESPLRIAVLLTCFNRKGKTLSALQALCASIDVNGVALCGIIVDDASTDGTSKAVEEQYPWVRVIKGDGGLFWCRGMHLAFAIALQGGGFDYYLWLNDDTMLFPDALARILQCASAVREGNSRPAIIVGSTVDATTGKLTYGGERFTSRWNRISFARVSPADYPLPCDSMNGNLVLIPADVARIVGNLDPTFEHAMGDTDYALRATKLGCAIWAAPGIHGTCSHNSVTNTYLDPTLSLSKRWRLMLSRKGLPWRSWKKLTSRHAGLLWPIFFCMPYFKFMVRAGISNSISRKTTAET